jgi:hypothetical protein
MDVEDDRVAISAAGREVRVDPLVDSSRQIV